MRGLPFLVKEIRRGFIQREENLIPDQSDRACIVLTCPARIIRDRNIRHTECCRRKGQNRQNYRDDFYDKQSSHDALSSDSINRCASVTCHLFMVPSAPRCCPGDTRPKAGSSILNANWCKQLPTKRRHRKPELWASFDPY